MSHPVLTSSLPSEIRCWTSGVRRLVLDVKPGPAHLKIIEVAPPKCFLYEWVMRDGDLNKFIIHLDPCRINVSRVERRVKIL